MRFTPRYKSGGAHALDAPVSGGDKGAIAGTLSIMVGGDSDDFERAMPLLEAMGKTIVHVGGPGAGQIVKACNQMVVAINYAAVSEALVAGAKAGVDPAKIVQVLSGGLAASRVLEFKGPGDDRASVPAGVPHRPAPERPRHRPGDRPRQFGARAGDCRSFLSSLKPWPRLAAAI